ncbi:ubiquitin-specific protease ubp2 [Sorochytrium milnesiophthora]
MGSAMGAGTREVEEAMYAIERKNTDIRQLKEEMTRMQADLDKQEQTIDQLEREVAQLQATVETYKADKAAMELAEKAQTARNTRPSTGVSDEVALTKELAQTRKQSQDLETQNNQLKRQLLELSTDANKRYNEQQNQMQGLEMMLEEIKRQYDEFIAVSKIEHDAYKALQTAEYEKIKNQFEAHKQETYDEKRSMVIEHQGMLYTLQSLFDEYRKTAEFLFNAEVVKLEDELMTQALRYENEILYIAQAKDKFYADMMVSKDAKIMSLIEGSDLQSVLQKHEMDIENIRKEYASEIERIKSQQENEQKNLISLLQRQNTTLEGKTEKLQLHIRTLEGKIKDLLSTVETKSKAIQEREEQKAQMESHFQGLLEQERSKVSQLSQEKEFLRHKVIRLNMQSKGEGENTIENMLKRISRDTTDLSKNYGELSIKYDELLEEHSRLQKRVKERERWIEVLEKEIKKRNEEYSTMTKTFEDFLVSRARQNQKERNRRLLKMHDLAAAGDPIASENQFKNITMHGSPAMLASSAPSSASGSRPFGGGGPSAHIPDVVDKPRVGVPRLGGLASEKQDLERGNAYLRRFKTLSKAFAKGEFRPVGDSTTQAPIAATETTGPWQNFPLYARLEHPNMLPPVSPTASAQPRPVAQLYHESRGAAWSDPIQHPKPLVYQPTERDNAIASSSSIGSGSEDSLRVYDYEVQQAKAVVESTDTPMIGAFRGSKVAAAKPSPKKAQPPPKPAKAPGPPLTIGAGSHDKTSATPGAPAK